MAKDKFTLMDFVKRQGLANITGVFGEECLNEDGTIMSMADQAAVITHYLKLRNSGEYIRPYENKAEQLLNLWEGFIEGRPQRSFEGMVADNSTLYMAYLFTDVHTSPFPPQQNPRFTFIDLFAGIGGFRMALPNLGGECVFSSEWDEQAQRTYYANFGEVPFGDITKERTKAYIPDNFDVLCAGFPCQAFSLAGKRLGFAETRGTLFFEVAEILRRKQPKAIFLENVKGLAVHDKGKTLKISCKKVDFKGPRDAAAKGIAAVYQHPTSYPDLTVAENIILGLEGKLNKKEAKAKIKEICDKEPNKNHVLFIDEITNVKSYVKNLVWDLIGERRINSPRKLELPSNCVIVAAGNRPDESASVVLDENGEVMPAPIRDRFDVHMEKGDKNYLGIY